MEYSWRHNLGLTDVGCSSDSPSPSLLSPNLNSFRRALLLVGIACFLAHAMVLANSGSGAAGRLLSNLLQLVLGLGAVAAMADAARRSQRLARRTWSYAAAALATYTLGQLIFLFYDLFARGVACLPRISDQFFFFWVVPLLAAAVIDLAGWPEGFDTNYLLDLAQLVVLGLALHLSVFGDTSRWLSHGREMEFLKWKVRIIRDVLVLGCLWARAWLSSSAQLRIIFARLGVFYAAYSVADAIYLYAEATWQLRPGTWLDLLWSVPRLLALYLALSWSSLGEADAPRPVRQRRSYLVLHWAPVLVPLVMLAMGSRTFFSAPVPWASLIVVSFAVAGTRLLLTQFRQERALADLHNSNRLLHNVVEGTSEAIYVKDPDGRYLLINAAGARTMGFPVKEIVGKTDRQLLSPATVEPIVKADHEVMATGAAVTCEEELVEAGQTRTFLSTKNPYRDAEGRIAGVLGVSVEITERRAIEEQLRRAQRMESIGTFSGAIAHDFNNLLTVIKGYSQMVQEQVAHHPEISGNVGQIEKATERAVSLTRQLLAFSRRQILQPRTINLNDIIANLQKMLHRLIGEDVQVVTHLAVDLKPVKADPGQIEQVVMNLAANARDAMPRGGKFALSTATVELKDGYSGPDANMPAGVYSVLTVSDTGSGMDARTRTRIFEPFFTTKPAGKGTGLGLATVYGIVKQSEGYIWVTSEPGAGTTFTIYLPSVSGPLEYMSVPAALRSAHANHETVLLVEDDPQVLDLAERLLKSSGYTVLSACSAEEAEALAGKHHGEIHLLLADVVLPGGSGRQLAARLRATRPETRVLYMSGYSDEAVSHHGVLEPGIDLLQKPFTPGGLVERVREALDAAAIPNEVPRFLQGEERCS